MQSNAGSLSDIQRSRKRLFREVVDTFKKKYSWLGHQTARELLLSAASWNLQEYSDPPFRYRTHVMLAWEKGWFKSTMLRKMSGILGDSMVTTAGKVTDAAIRGSSSGGQFTPPKVLKAPIMVSTEFGQTDFSDELLNIFLALLEEGETNISMNKIGGISDTQRKEVQKRYDDRVEFTDENEFDLKSNFVFWGGTYDPTKLEDDALRSRFNIVTPAKPLDYEVTKCADRNNFYIDEEVVQEIRHELQNSKEMETTFTPPENLYEKYNLEPRESAPLQSYMACRNWWGLKVNPEVMENFIKELKRSRRLAKMSPEDRVYDLIFDNPMTYPELIDGTGYDRKDLFKILNNINKAERIHPSLSGESEVQWVVYSSSSKEHKEKQDGGIEGLLNGD
jgi:hypothetical protein